jgi:hypothetical protein
VSTEFILETALAWHIDPYKVEELARWVQWNVSRHRQSQAFAALLRRYANTCGEDKATMRQRFNQPKGTE